MPQCVCFNFRIAFVRCHVWIRKRELICCHRTYVAAVSMAQHDKKPHSFRFCRVFFCRREIYINFFFRFPINWTWLDHWPSLDLTFLVFSCLVLVSLPFDLFVWICVFVLDFRCCYTQLYMHARRIPHSTVAKNCSEKKEGRFSVSTKQLFGCDFDCQ